MHDINEKILLEWVPEITNETMKIVHLFIQQHIKNNEQLNLLTLALIDLENYQKKSLYAHIHMPLLIYHDIDIASLIQAKIEITVVTTLIEAGILLLDHLADNELNSLWQSTPLAAISLTAYTLIFTLPHLYIIKLAISSDVKMLLLQFITEHYITISAGQIMDHCGENNVLPTMNQHLDATANKTGRWQLYAGIAILLAKGQLENHHYLQFGYYLGRLRQTINDYADIFVKDDSQDMMNGVKNTVITGYMQSLTDSEQALFAEQLTHAKTNKETRDKIKQTIFNSNQRMGGLVLGLYYKKKAVALLEQFATKPLPKYGLEMLVNQSIPW